MNGTGAGTVWYTDHRKQGKPAQHLPAPHWVDNEVGVCHNRLMQFSELVGAHLRVARPTNDLAAVVSFYRDGLGFEVLSEFADHDGFDGVMLGHPGAAYHLEFTCGSGHPTSAAPTEENLLVFYLPDVDTWQRAIARLAVHGYQPVPSVNPYWDRHGRTFVDPDGYRVVLQNAAWFD